MLLNFQPNQDEPRAAGIIVNSFHGTQMAQEPSHSLLGTFERIRIINLQSRPDRRREVESEFAKLGLSIDGDRIAFHDASRPSDPAGFPTIGARGCFLSHLGVLQSAMDDGVRNVLILEDDLDFSPDAAPLIQRALERLSEVEWAVFYGGVLDYTIPAEVGSETPIWSPSPDNHLLGTHFVALSKEMIQLAVPYLNSIMSRPEGSPDGGPMHVDGAYSWLRRAYPEKRTWIAAPVLGHQRSSRTDVHELGLLDTIPVLRDAVAIARRAKRYLMRA